MLYDVLDYMLPPVSFTSGKHLAGTANPLYAASALGTPNKIYQMKGNYAGQGYPWDINLYDDNYVYLWATEHTWLDPHTSKRFCSTQWNCGGLGGVPLSPRMFDPLAGYYEPIITTDSSFRIYTSCSASTLQNLGKVRTQLYYLGTQTFGNPASPGNLPGGLDTILCTYEWSDMGTRERFWFARGFGWVKWDTANYDSTKGLYVVNQESDFFQIVTGGSPAPYWPC